ncbi:MAG: asparaginase [Candidatus Micrarchaeota archaeon]|nr:asparaginase [Candidatus Micrarchaeota archaeon]
MAKKSVRKKIALIFCGGTIAMAKNEKTGALQPTLNPEQLYALVPKIREHADIRVEYVTNKDSIDLDTDDWKSACNAIQKNMHHVDAFVITHGTDSMVQTACAISFAFGNSLCKPVIMTGSMASPQELGTDAASNIERAIKVALSTARPEVMISFNDTVLCGTRTRKTSEKLGAYHSPALPPLAEHYGDQIRWHPASSVRTGRDEYLPHFSDNVLTLVLEPAMNAAHLDACLNADPKTAGVVLISLGAGYIPRTCHAAIRHAVKNDVPVVVTSAFPGAQLNMRAYQHGFEALDLGVIPAGDMTPEAASTKLKWALGVAQANKEPRKKGQLTAFVRDLFSEVRAGEMTPLPKGTR